MWISFVHKRNFNILYDYIEGKALGSVCSADHHTVQSHYRVQFSSSISCLKEVNGHCVAVQLDQQFNAIGDNALEDSDTAADIFINAPWLTCTYLTNCIGYPI